MLPFLFRVGASAESAGGERELYVHTGCLQMPLITMSYIRRRRLPYAFFMPSAVFRRQEKLGTIDPDAKQRYDER